VSNIAWCTAPFHKYCYFTETLTTVETLSGGKVSTIRAAGKGKPTQKAVVVGTKKVKLAGGHTITVNLGLNGTGRQFLKRFGNVPVTFSGQLLRAGKQVTIAKRKLTIKPKPKPKKKNTSKGPLLGGVRLDWPAL
jgi:hypothetical protein